MQDLARPSMTSFTSFTEDAPEVVPSTPMVYYQSKQLILHCQSHWGLLIFVPHKGVVLQLPSTPLVGDIITTEAWATGHSTPTKWIGIWRWDESISQLQVKTLLRFSPTLDSEDELLTLLKHKSTLYQLLPVIEPCTEMCLAFGSFGNQLQVQEF